MKSMRESLFLANLNFHVTIHTHKVIQTAHFPINLSHGII